MFLTATDMHKSMEDLQETSTTRSNCKRYRRDGRHVITSMPVQ